MSILPVELMKIAAKQLSPSLPLSEERRNSSIATHKRTVQKTHDGQHWYIAGRTGTGKTKFIKEVVKRKRSIDPHLNLYFLDTKKIGDFTNRDGVVIFGDTVPDAFTTTGNALVWQPVSDNRRNYDRFFHNILNAKLPSIVVIDECVNVKFGDEIPRELAILAMQGRAAGIHIMAGTQQVAKSPRELLSQATYIVSFLLTKQYDVTTMLSALDLDTRKLDLRKYEFYVRDTDTDKPAIKYRSYQEFIPKVH